MISCDVETVVRGFHKEADRDRDRENKDAEITRGMAWHSDGVHMDR